MTNNPNKSSPKIGRRNSTYAALPVDDPAEYEELSETAKASLAAWIEIREGAKRLAILINRAKGKVT